MFMSQCALDPYYKIEPTKFLESSLAALTGVIFGNGLFACQFLVVFTDTATGFKILRRQIVSACDGALNIGTKRFGEYRSRFGPTVFDTGTAQYAFKPFGF